MTEGKKKEILRLKQKISKLYRTKCDRYRDLYYHDFSSGKSYIKTLPERKALKVVISETRRMCKEGKDNLTTALFNCETNGIYPPAPVEEQNTLVLFENKDKIDLFKTLISASLDELDIDIEERKQWLHALTIKN